MAHVVTPPSEKPDYSYVRHVTLGQFFKHFTQVFALWVGLSVATVVFGFLFDVAKATVVHRTFLDEVPKQFWTWLAIAIFSWVLRGQTIPITLPKLSFVAWGLLNIWIGGAMIANAFLPWWAASPIYWGLFLLGFTFEQLAEMGRANYENLMPTAIVDSAAVEI